MGLASHNVPLLLQILLTLLLNLITKVFNFLLGSLSLLLPVLSKFDEPLELFLEGVVLL